VTGASIEELTTLSGLLGYLRGLAATCEPPIGVGSFVVLYASQREVVVWYSPAREEHREGEVSIPCRRVAAAWEALIAGQTLDEAALEALGEGPAGGRWLLALLAQAPGVRVEAPLALAWSAEEAMRRLLATRAVERPAKGLGRRRSRVSAEAKSRARAC
jgi:hypothetical protein